CRWSSSWACCCCGPRACSDERWWSGHERVHTGHRRGRRALPGAGRQLAVDRGRRAARRRRLRALPARALPRLPAHHGADLRGGAARAERPGRARRSGLARARRVLRGRRVRCGDHDVPLGAAVPGVAACGRRRGVRARPCAGRARAAAARPLPGARHPGQRGLPGAAAQTVRGGHRRLDGAVAGQAGAARVERARRGPVAVLPRPGRRPRRVRAGREPAPVPGRAGAARGPGQRDRGRGHGGAAVVLQDARVRLERDVRRGGGLRLHLGDRVRLAGLVPPHALDHAAGGPRRRRSRVAVRPGARRALRGFRTQPVAGHQQGRARRDLRPPDHRGDVRGPGRAGRPGGARRERSQEDPPEGVTAMRLTAIGRTAVTGTLVLAAAACGGRGETGGEAVATGAAQEQCQGQQTTGITDTTLKLGGIYPLSGPASAYGDIPKGIQAYFDYVNNEQGGIDGRKVEFVVRDDGYQPPKAVEEARRLVEQEEVFALFQTLGTPSTTATWDYANQRKVPQVFVATGASQWGTDTEHPWTIGWQPNYISEARVYAAYLKKEKPDAKVAILYQNDDFGEDLSGGFKKAIEGTGITVVAEQSYEVTDPSVDPQMRNLAESGADVFLNITTPKFGSQALAADVKNTKWNPLHIVNNVAASVTVLKPVGFENVQGIVSSSYYQDPNDPQWEDDAEMKLYKEKMAQYAPGSDPN